MDEPGGHCAKCNESETEKDKYDLTHMWNLKNEANKKLPCLQIHRTDLLLPQAWDEMGEAG